MPFQILKDDLCSLACDAIVNPTDEVFSGSGGLDARIHHTAGPELAQACAPLAPLAIGRAVITPAFRLPCFLILHTVAPWWSGQDEDVTLLRDCYRSALELVKAHGLRRVAFPLIGSGTRGFPKELVLRIAAEELSRALAVLEDCELLLVVHDRSEFQPDPALLSRWELFRRDRQVIEEDFPLAATGSFPALSSALPPDALYRREAEDEPRRPAPNARKGARLDSSVLHHASFRPDRQIELDESFSQMVMRKIDERGFQKDSDCYTRANIDRRLFSRLRCDEHYHPKKTTALALAVALELSLSETRELLDKAGYSLSHSLLSDLIVEYCIRENIYDIFAINELLFQYDQPLLGG